MYQNSKQIKWQLPLFKARIFSYFDTSNQFCKCENSIDSFSQFIRGTKKRHWNAIRCIQINSLVNPMFLLTQNGQWKQKWFWSCVICYNTSAQLSTGTRVGQLTRRHSAGLGLKHKTEGEHFLWPDKQLPPVHAQNSNFVRAIQSVWVV